MKTNTLSCAPALPALRGLLALATLLVILPARPVAAFSPVITKIYAKNSQHRQLAKIVTEIDAMKLAAEKAETP
jgi:hypothetical protein